MRVFTNSFLDTLNNHRDTLLKKIERLNIAISEDEVRLTEDIAIILKEIPNCEQELNTINKYLEDVYKKHLKGISEEDEKINLQQQFEVRMDRLEDLQFFDTYLKSIVFECKSAEKKLFEKHPELLNEVSKGKSIISPAKNSILSNF